MCRHDGPQAPAKIAKRRDLLGHSSVRTTEHYLSRLDMTRIYRDAYQRAGQGLVGDEAARA